MFHSYLTSFPLLAPYSSLYMHLSKLQTISRRDRPFVVLLLERAVCLPHYHIIPCHQIPWRIQKLDMRCPRIIEGFFLSLISSSIICTYLVIRWFMISFVDGPMYPVNTLCGSKMYVLSTDSSTIVLSAVYMLLWFSFMRQTHVCSSLSFKQTAVVFCAGNCAVPTGSMGTL